MSNIISEFKKPDGTLTTIEKYTPRVPGAKDIGSTELRIDHTGGFNQGPNEITAKLPNGRIIQNDTYNGQGLHSLKNEIKRIYIQLIDEKNKNN